ncbi:S41 family peptidase [Ruminiclostridium papyrosolvens]|uniref:Peptidase S41 n=1 Tax=Ruminiclostridium papyrosolvens C7 TaxID=1330534 RepID=U4R5Q7_9FIRM|nr:S41 family peptidase [Ruminiclostridium papyrosolvens]EPR13738.1 peptidase S41 [Ruminiclostridium papyrosolvens C7]
MNKLKRITGIFLAISISMTVFTSAVFAADSKSTDGEYLQSVIDLIKQKYNGNITDDELLQGALKGMFDTLDQYSAYYTPEEFEEFYGSLEGAVEGVGISIELIDKNLIINKVFANSPAKKAGVLSGDRIVQVNGESVQGKELNEVVSKIKGTAGTKVKLGLMRQGTKNMITLEMSRAQVDLPSVHYEIRGNIGYILIDSFSQNTSKGVSEALGYFDSKKITSVVLDLRNNPGGYLDQAIAVAQNFVPKGIITTLDYKDSSMEDKKFYSELEKIKYKLAVLVNENTASAAEILTGAIKDTKAGVVIGCKTFGKAKVQESLPILSDDAYDKFNDGSDKKSANAYDFNSYTTDLSGWAKMTIGLYYTPNGNCIDLKGIEPDIQVKDLTLSGIRVNLLEPMSLTVKPSLGTHYYDVLNAECALKLLKYNIGTPDYILDAKSVEAIKKFQKSNKLSSSGILDFTTQRLLNTKMSEIKQKQDAVYSRAVSELLK